MEAHPLHEHLDDGDAGDGTRYANHLAPEASFTNLRGVKAMPGGIALPTDGVVRTQLMEVFVRRDGQWWIEAYHNVDTKPLVAVDDRAGSG